MRPRIVLCPRGQRRQAGRFSHPPALRRALLPCTDATQGFTAAPTAVYSRRDAVPITPTDTNPLATPTPQAKLELCTGPASGEGHTRCPDLACQFQCPLRVILKANRCAHQNEHAIACLILDRTANARCCHTTSQVIASLLASIPEPRAFESEKTVGNRRDSSGPPARGLPIRAAARVCGRSCRRLRHPERQLDVGQIESLRIQAFTSQRHWPAGAFRSGWLAFPD